jgi:predicted nucleic acid-binding protein
MDYVDSNVFVYAVIYREDDEKKTKKAKEILLQIEKQQLHACTSTLTWDELVWVVSKTNGKEEGICQGQKLLGFPNLDFVNVDEAVLALAQKMMEKYKLAPRDSIHLACAHARKASHIISDDDVFDKVKEIKRIPLV